MHTAIKWFAHNPVAANLLMVLLLLSGTYGALSTNQEEFPSFDIKVVNVTVPYLGAAPVEVEKSVCVRVEEAIEGLDGIDKVRSLATEGMCNITSELMQDASEISVLNEIKSRVDGINTFPVETEKPIVSKVALTRRVVQIAVSGNTDERTLKEIATKLRDRIAAVEGISQVNVGYIRPYEISIEVSENVLRRYGITLNQISQAIRNNSLDMPGGTIRTDNGEILIRTTGQAYWGQEFEDMIVLTQQDGTRVALRDIAQIRDTFAEGDLLAQFNGRPGVVVNVSQVGNEDLIEIAQDVREQVANFAATEIPPDIYLDTWIDTSYELQERMSVLIQNAGGGLVLVLVILALFLRFRVAMWVSIGIPVALLGTLGALPFTDINISTMTVMGFILVLGIVVDDAIVVGERVYGHEQMGKTPLQAAVDGTWEVSVPVIFGVLTTVAAFLPLIMVEGRMAGFFAPIGWVVIFALVCSIVESQLILPAHLAHRKQTEAKSGFGASWNIFQGRLASWLENVALHRYMPFVKKVLKLRYISASICLGILILSLSLILSGRVVFGFFPSIEGDRVYAGLELPEGIAAKTTLLTARKIESAAMRLSDDMTAELKLDQPLVRNIFASVGKGVDRNGPGGPAGPGESNRAEIVLDLAPIKERAGISSKVVAARWREYVGPISDAVSLTFDSDSYSAGAPIEYQLKGESVDELRAASETLKYQLTGYTGVFDIRDSFRSGKQEIQLSLTPEARNLGLTLADMAGQVRSGFYGSEAQRIQRNKDDVRVMVRFPETERKSIGNLEDMYVRTPNGNEVPFYSVAKFSLERGYSSIRRLDGQRVVTVSAEVDREAVAPEEVSADIAIGLIPSFKAEYPNLEVSLGGEGEERTTAMTGLLIGALFSLVLIYGLLAIPLKSYLQPLVIMSVIPFGAVGAIVGHFALNVQLMFFSALGIVALSGVVVNASLVLVDYANRQRREGKDIMTSILDACVVRFRPIMLTSVTTFVGLIPLMSTTTPATAPFKPMAVSLAWGVLFATFITLLLVPCLYLMVEDWMHTLARLKAWIKREPAPLRTDGLGQESVG
ncbi:MAG: efflux RND transporter permease subunit [Gammaproteobacteria bacterium]|jgi:multidrug efflux pump subunit AcrB|nr:efflux RND transporter permease subunit [Gammaproteobacteria bacterium]